MGTKRNLDITEEERQRRSELAKELHSKVVDPETGRRAFGGRQPGAGRPRKIRAAELVAEEAKKNADKIVAAFKDSLDVNQPPSVRLTAAREWLSIENKEAELQLKEEKEYHNYSDEELALKDSEGMLRLNSTGALDQLLGEATDATVVNGEIVDDDEPDF